MFSRKIAMASLAAVLALKPVTRATADGADLAAGLIGGLIGSAIMNDMSRKKTTLRRATPKMSRATRQANMDAQSALNYFGFPAGRPDGVLGRKSRAAISELQATVRFPVSGKLNAYQRNFLHHSYYRALANPADATRLANKSPQGARGILVAYREERLGIRRPVQKVKKTAAVSVNMARQAAAPALIPNLFGTESPSSASLASHCNTVSLL